MHCIGPGLLVERANHSRRCWQRCDEPLRVFVLGLDCEHAEEALGKGL